jgi:hypothetical protein
MADPTRAALAERLAAHAQWLREQFPGWVMHSDQRGTIESDIDAAAALLREPEPQGIDRPNYPFGGRCVEEPTDEAVALLCEAVVRYVGPLRDWTPKEQALMEYVRAVNAARERARGATT